MSFWAILGSILTQALAYCAMPLMPGLLKARLPVVKCIATIQHELGLKYHCLEIGWEMAPIFRGKEHMIIIILIYAHTKYQGQCSQKCRDKHSYCSKYEIGVGGFFKLKINSSQKAKVIPIFWAWAYWFVGCFFMSYKIYLFGCHIVLSELLK